MEVVSMQDVPPSSWKSMRMIGIVGMLIVYAISSYRLLLRTWHGANNSLMAMAGIVLIMAALIIFTLVKAIKTNTVSTWTTLFRACWFAGIATAIAVLIH